MPRTLSDRAQDMFLGAALTAGVGVALYSLRKRKCAVSTDTCVRVREQAGGAGALLVEGRPGGFYPLRNWTAQGPSAAGS